MTQYLKRTPTSTGNNKVFTWSGWVKRNKFSNVYVGSQNLFRASGGSGGDCGWRFDYTTPNDSLRVFLNGASSGNVQADGKSRDPGTWMHVMVAFNSTLEQDSARVRIYVNGVLTPDNNAGYPTKNFETSWNETIAQYIGTYNGSGEFFHGGMCDVFVVDGQALTPDVFGFYKDGDGYISAGSTQATDFRPGQWVPKSPSVIKNVIDNNGGFGVNGFYLPMNDSSNPGADFHCDPNSIITLKGEDLPQPRNGAPTTSDAYVSQLRSDPNAANLVLAVPGASTATGATLITNGTFDSNISNWTATDNTQSWNNGQLQINRSGGGGGTSYQAFTTEVGKRYTVVGTVNSSGSRGDIRVYDGTGFGGTTLLAMSGTAGQIKTLTGSFTAASTTTSLGFSVDNNGTTIYVDNIEVKQENVPIDYSADIKGSGTNKTLTANGNAGVGYGLGGYYGSAMTFDGTGDYLSIASNSDFALGTGDFTVECWAKFDTLTGISDLLAAGTQNGGWALYASTLQVGFVAQNIAALSGQNLTTNEWIHIAAERYGTNVTIYVNGVASVVANPFAHDITQNGLAIGAQITGADATEGHIQDVRVYKGVAKYKGGFDVPKPYTPVGFEGDSWRTITDTCKNNFATLNPLFPFHTDGVSYSDGNLFAQSSNDNKVVQANMAFTSGKWYWETRNYKDEMIGIGVAGGGIGHYPGTNSNGLSYHFGGAVYDSGTSTNYGAGWAGQVYHIIGIAVDKDNDKVYWHVDGVWANSADPVSGTGGWSILSQNAMKNAGVHVAPSWRVRASPLLASKFL